MDDQTRRTVLETLRRDEGFRGMPYACTEDRETIGYGTALPVTKEEAEWLLEHRLGEAVVDLDHAIWRRRKMSLFLLPQAVQSGLAQMAYQLGVAGVLKFRKMLAAIQAEDWERAESEALDSRWAAQTPARAKRVARLIGSGRSGPRREVST